jgi:hypothetical protein
MNVGGFTTGDILALYDRLSFDDSPMGVRVSTAKVPRESIHAEAVTKRIPGVAMLDITRGADSAGLIPKWSGARTRSGEVWRREAGLNSVLVHASATAVTVVQPDLEDSGESERLTFLDAVTEISWHG